MYMKKVHMCMMYMYMVHVRVYMVHVHVHVYMVRVHVYMVRVHVCVYMIRSIRSVNHSSLGCEQSYITQAYRDIETESHPMCCVLSRNSCRGIECVYFDNDNGVTMVTTAPFSLFGRVWRDQLRRCHNCWGGTQSTRRPHVCVDCRHT